MSDPDERIEKLPFEPWTVLRAITHRPVWLVAVAVLALVTGGYIGRRYVPDLYEARAVLLYSPLVGEDGGGMQLPRLESRRHMVKVPSSLDQVIRRRGLAVTPVTLGNACEVRTERDSNVLEIVVAWSHPELAAQIANALCDVFLEQQIQIRRVAAGRFITDLERQQAHANQGLAAAADALKRFRQERDASSIDEQIRVALADLFTLRSQLHQARMEQDAIALQRRSIDQLIENVRRRLPSPAAPTVAGPSSPELAERMHRLRAAIEEDRTARERATTFTRAGVELARGQKQLASGLVAAADVDRLVTVYERAKELAVDTPQIQKWRTQIDEIERHLAVAPVAGQATGEVRPELALRAFQVELDGVAIDKKVKYLTAAVESAQTKMASFPALQREYFELQSISSRHERELAALEGPLALARRARDSDASDFVMVSRAVAPAVAYGHRKALATAGLGVGLLGAALALIALRAALDPRIRSGRELAHVTELPVWGQSARPRATAEASVRLSPRLGRPAAGRGRCLVVTGCAPLEARARAAQAVVAQLARQGLRVASIALERTDGVLRAAACPAGAAGDALPVGPHVQNLVRAASARFDAVVIQAGSPLEAPDELALADASDAVILVAEAHRTGREEARRTARSVSATVAVPCGWLLMDVSPAFVGLEADAMA